MGRDAPHERPTTLTAALLAVVVAAAGTTIALAVAASGSAPQPVPGQPLAISTSLSPQEHLFGDRVSADATVEVQRDLIDPRSVAILASFAPYTPVGRPGVTRDGDAVRLHATLTCLTSACAPRAPRHRLEISPVRVRFRAAGRERVVSQAWPSLLVASRLTRADLAHPALEVRLLPPVVAGPDRRLGWSLTAAASLLFLLAGLPLVARLFRRVSAPVAAAPEQGELARARAEVERFAGDDDAARRLAVDDLAAALAGAGLEEAAPEARAVAWSRRPPDARRLRRLLESIDLVTRRRAA